MTSQVSEPNAMTLATVDKKGNPNARMVLMKGIGEDAIRFFTNYESTKARELDNNPHAACVFWWPELERQIRMRGAVMKIGSEESAEYVWVRHAESQGGAGAAGQRPHVRSRR